MALEDKAVFTAATGYILTGEVGTVVRPTPAEVQGFTSLTGLSTGWTQIGHTSADELPEFGFEGGESETRGSWQKKVLASIIPEAAVDYVTMQLLQFDDEAMSLYYGTANQSLVAGEFAVGGEEAAASLRALCMIIVDGTRKIAFYAPKASIIREESISLATDEFGALPIRATFLDPDDTDESAMGHRFAWIAGDVTLLNPDVVPAG